MNIIFKAVKTLNDGGIVIFPTDTAFGIGCRMDDEKAVERLFSIRRRPLTQATPVLVDSAGMAEKYTLSPFPKIVRHLIHKYWPGALTLILAADPHKVPLLVRGQGLNLGVRQPDHETALAIIRGVGVPILGPSANFHGGDTAYIYEDLDERLTGLVDLVVPGNCKSQQASTVVDCTFVPFNIIRQGSIRLTDDEIGIR